MPDWLEQTLGALLMIAVLIDVFLTVLYERSRMGVISFYSARAVWRVFYGVASLFERHRGAIMSYCGPAILVVGLLVWVMLLTIGAGLVIHPAWCHGQRREPGYRR